MPPVEWEPSAVEELRQIAEWLDEHPFGNGTALYHGIRDFVTSLGQHPEAHPVWETREDAIYRRCLYRHRYWIIYISFPPSLDDPDGLVSIRAVRDAKRKHPFFRVRESAPSEAVGGY